MPGGNIKKTKKVVVDASFILAGLVPDEKRLDVDQAFFAFKNGEVDFISSRLLPFEVLNGLKTIFLQKRVDQNLAQILAKKFLNMHINLLDVDNEEALRLAFKNDLTFYDASYLWVTVTESAELLSFDKKLQKAFQK